MSREKWKFGYEEKELFEKYNKGEMIDGYVIL